MESNQTAKIKPKKNNKLMFYLLGGVVCGFSSPFWILTSLAQQLPGYNKGVSIDNKIQCNINVRIIKGMEASPTSDKRSLIVGKFLTDMKNQLQPLPYSRFDIVDSSEQIVSLNKQALFEVQDIQQKKHKLLVMPHDFDHQKVWLTVNWDGPRGEQLLSTRMHVSNGKSVVLGTENTGQQSTIMSVKTSCY